jgi:hypothetical protein
MLVPITARSPCGCRRERRQPKPESHPFS